MHKMSRKKSQNEFRHFEFLESKHKHVKVLDAKGKIY